MAGPGLGAVVACLAVVLSNPSGPGCSSPALSDARQVVERSGRLTGCLPGEATFLPSFPLWTMLLARHFPPTHNLVRDFHLHSIYFTVFLYGYWMGVDTGVWRELERLRRCRTS